MTAQEREPRQETPSMHQLLASCAAADAVSTPPESGAEAAQDAETPRASGVPYTADASAAAILAVPEQRPGRDAA
ncbi:hypothetical protein [Streptomyces sp. ODS28]|uniref:hypothetical protein n=1 Tax=Streptomyces sp. ODS28 TaxID=3136688 RepID=UPI0031F1B1F8